MESYLFDTFTNRFIISGKLTALTGLHIGGRQGRIVPAATDSTVIKDIYGRPYIPGSSLKGVMRAFAERIAQPVFNGHVCDIFDNKNSCSAKINAERRSRGMELDPQYIYDNYLCDACRIFGNQGMAGRLMIKDAMLMPNGWDHGVYDIRDGVAIDRDSNTAVNKAKYDYEVVPVDTEFQFGAVADNIDEKSWQYVLAILMAMANGDISIGGLSTRGLGRINLEDVAITKIDPSNLKEYMISRQGGTTVSLEQEVKEVFGNDVQTA